MGQTEIINKVFRHFFKKHNEYLEFDLRLLKLVLSLLVELLRWPYSYSGEGDTSPIFAPCGMVTK